MEQQSKNYFGLGNKESLLPQEEKLEVGNSKKQLTIGLPKETSYQECRISLIPDAVKALTENGHRVIVQRGAGSAARFEDIEYAEAGALLTAHPAEVFRADVILKVAPVSTGEIDLLKGQQKLISALHLTTHNKNYFKRLIQKKVTAVAFEFIKDKTNDSPVVRSISEIAGTTSIHIAAEYMSQLEYGTGRMLGGFTGIAPSEVVIIGAGTVGEFAARTAIGMGALVKVFDNSVYKLRRLKSFLNQNVFTSTIQSGELIRALQTADVLISAVHSKQLRAQIFVTEEMVAGMKKGAIIVDVSIDQGGCVETSHITNHNDPVFTQYNVTHYCVPNIASRVPQTASIAFSNFFAPVLIRAGELGGIEKLMLHDYYFRQGGYLYNGILTSKLIGEYYDLPAQDIDLLMAAFH
nr:alanine dehydrogenase [Bacteroidota bacterium]